MDERKASEPQDGKSKLGRLQVVGTEEEMALEWQDSDELQDLELVRFRNSKED